MSALRTLPARPSLEYEQKEAKAFLRLLKAGEVAALARARERHAGFERTAPDEFKLADAQLVLAREYGFASWPRMVRYFDDLEMLRLGRHVRRTEGRERAERSARALMVAHAARRTYAGRAFAAYVPRCYGASLEQVFAATVTEEEARLAHARMQGAVDWEALIAQPELAPSPDASGGRANAAIGRLDLGELQRIAAENPQILHPSGPPTANGWRIMMCVIHHEREQGREALRPILDWLGAQGVDFQAELQLQLCGHMHMRPEKVRWLLDRGADPNWVAPNGIPLLEHALLLYWDGEAVDILAARTTPRKALWIAAGLGDLAGVRRSLDAKGRPLPEGVKLRPPFDAVGAHSLASHPEPDDEELLMEALFVAMINGRVKVIEYLASRGAPLDSLVYGSPALNMAVGNGWVPVVEALVNGGAGLDVRGTTPDQTPRELAREMFVDAPDRPGRRRIAELCGWDPDQLLAGRTSSS